MRVLQVGFGHQGKKRCAVAGQDIVAKVDPVDPQAQYQTLDQVPINSFDAAIVSTPDAPKLGLVKFLISEGKNVLVEKPLLSRDSAEIAALADLCRITGAIWYTAYNHRFEPTIKALKTLLESGELGPIYTARFFYGNGTARNVRQSWRDETFGVLSDLGSHLIDLSAFLFGSNRPTFLPWSLRQFENRAFDHILLGSSGLPVIQLEATYLSWRNTFTIDVLCELGSVHVLGLCKWGPSQLIIRKRVFPSGKPHESVETVDGVDPTWDEEYQYFKSLCQTGRTNLENDLWINSIILSIAQLAGAKLAL